MERHTEKVPKGGSEGQRQDAAVSNIIGTIIVFAFVVILLAIFQVAAVPIWNQSVEFEHSQRVQDDVGQLHDSIVLSATTGRATTQSVELGTQYPRRLLFINPANPSGSMSTLETGEVSVTNAASGDGDVRDYWGGNQTFFETTSFVYEPEYNEYSNAPGTVIDNNLVFNQAEERQVLLTEQSLVSGRNINLNLLGGSLSRQGVLSRGVNVNPVSAPSQVITVTNSTDAPVEITLPTRLNEQRWTEALENERVENGGRIADVTYTEGEPYSELTLSMERGVGYDLRMSKVALGEREQRQTAHYIVNRGEHSRAVAAGTTERVYVEVRDRYNNPVSGVDVNTELQAPGGTDPGTLTPVQPRTDAEGVASFEYEATGDAPTVGATFSIGENATAVARERVSVAFDVIEDGGGGGDDGGGGIDQGTESNVFVSSVDRLSGGSSNEANVRFRNEGTDKQIDAAEFVFFYDSSNCPCADRLRLGNTGPVLEAAEGMRTLNQPVELPAGQTTVNFDFGSSGGGGGFSVRRGDFAVVRFEFSDGSRSTYFIQFQTN